VNTRGIECCSCTIVLSFDTRWTLFERFSPLNCNQRPDAFESKMTAGGVRADMGICARTAADGHRDICQLIDSASTFGRAPECVSTLSWRIDHLPWRLTCIGKRANRQDSRENEWRDS
jgi:hypothetical protein